MKLSTTSKNNDNTKGSVKMPINLRTSNISNDVDEAWLPSNLDRFSPAETKDIRVFAINKNSLTSLLAMANFYFERKEIGAYNSVFKSYLPKAMMRVFGQGMEPRPDFLAYLCSHKDVCSLMWERVPIMNAEQFVRFLHIACGIKSSVEERAKIASFLYKPKPKENDLYNEVELQGVFIPDQIGLDDSTKNLFNSFLLMLSEKLPSSEERDTLLQQISSLNVNIENLHSPFKNISVTDIINNVVPNSLDLGCGEIPSKYIFASLVCFACYKLNSTGNFRWKALAPLFFMGLMQTSEEEERIRILTLFLPLVVGSYVTSPTVELQSGTSDALVSALLAYITMGRNYSFDTRKFTESFRLAKDLPDFVDRISEGLTSLINSVSLSLLGYELISPKYAEFSDVEMKFKILADERSRGSLTCSVANADRIEMLLNQFNKIYMDIGSSNRKRHISAVCMNRIKYLENLKAYMGGFLVDPRGIRQEPVSIILAGLPGTYKSVLCSQLERVALSISLPEQELEEAFKNLQSYVFTRVATEYWEGYNSLTEVVTIDDFGQVRDSCGSPNVNFEDLIHMYNTKPFPLNMANVNEKGKVYFRAKWIISSTNMVNGFGVQSLNSEAAIERRFDLFITPVPKDEYNKLDEHGRKTGKLDISHPDIMLDGDTSAAKITLDLFNFEVQRSNEKFGLRKGAILSHKELKILMKRLYDLKQKYFEYEVKSFTDSVQLQSGGAHYGDYMQAYEIDSYSRPKKTRIVPQIPCLTFVDSERSYEIWNETFHDALRVSYSESGISQYYWPGKFKISSGEFEAHLEHFGKWKLYALLDVIGFLEFNYGDIKKDIPPSIMQYSHVARCAAIGLDDVDILISWYTGSKISYDKGEVHVRKRSAVEVLTELPTIMNPSLARTDLERFVLELARKGFITVSSLAVSGIVGLAVKTIWTYFASAPSTQGNYVQPYRSKDKRTRLARIGKVDRALKLQGGDLSGAMMARNVLNRNCYVLTVRTPDNDCELGIVTFIKSDKVIMPLHFYEALLKSVSSEEELNDHTFILKGTTCTLTFTYSELFHEAFSYDKGGAHIIICKVSKHTFAKRDLLDYFMTERDVCSLQSSGLSVLTFLNSERFAAVISEAKIDKVDFKVLKMAKGIHYSADSAQGDCGVPLFIRNKRFQKRRIIGFHLAGLAKGHSLQNAYANVVTKEALEEVLSHFDDTELQSGESTLYKKIGEVEHFHNVYSKTKIVPSILKDTSFPDPCKYPAYCLPGDNGDPYEKALSKYFKRPIHYHEGVFESAVDDLTSFLLSQEGIALDEVVPLEEALWGSSVFKNRKAVPSSTSPGYPLKFTDGRYKSRFLPLTGEDYPMNTPDFEELETEIWEIIEDARLGRRREWIYTDSLKDETLPLQKVLDGKARLFCGTPFKLMLVTKMLFGEFVEFYFDNCLDKGNASTLNPYTGWGTLAKKLEQFDENFETCVADSSDFKAFDASNNEVVMKGVLEVIQSWYEAHDSTLFATAREVIFKEIYNSKHLAGNSVYEWEGSLPSGSYLTLVVNCLSNHLLFRYAYYKNILEFNHSYKVFSNRVYFCALGDDNIYSASHDIRDDFTPEYIGRAVRDLGFTMTSDSKGDLGSWRKLKDITFLKRGFHKEGTLYYCPLDIDTIMSTPCWSRQGELYHKITEDNVEWFFRELSLHDSNTWEAKASLMRKALQEASLVNGVPNAQMSQGWWRSVVLSDSAFIVEF